MHQHPYIMDAHANYKRTEVERTLAKTEMMKQVRAHKNSVELADTPLVGRSAPTFDIAGIVQGLRFRVHSPRLALRGRAVA